MPCSDPCSDFPLGGPFNLCGIAIRMISNCDGMMVIIMSDDDDINENNDNKLNEMAPYIGLSGTFRPELSSCCNCPVVVRTSTSGVFELVSTSGTAHCWVHRVGLVQCRRANEVASQTSIGEEWGVNIE